jgi:hypothetical protein
VACRLAALEVAHERVEIVLKALHALFTLLVETLYDRVSDHGQLLRSLRGEGLTSPGTLARRSPTNAKKPDGLPRELGDELELFELGRAQAIPRALDFAEKPIGEAGFVQEKVRRLSVPMVSPVTQDLDHLGGQELPQHLLLALVIAELVLTHQRQITGEMIEEDGRQPLAEMIAARTLALDQTKIVFIEDLWVAASPVHGESTISPLTLLLALDLDASNFADPHFVSSIAA